MSNRQQKLELMTQARRAGWKGKTFRKAKRFERKLDREAKALAAAIAKGGAQ